MYEIDFLPIGEQSQSGDAIAMRFTRPDNGGLAHVLIDGGFQADGQKVVDHFRNTFGVNAVDLVILTHPDGDHIGGLGTVLRELDVDALAAHNLSNHGGATLRAATALNDLFSLAKQHGVDLYEPFEGLNGFGEALVVAGPSKDAYEALVDAEVQIETSKEQAKPVKKAGPIAEAISRLSARAISHFPIELPFDDAGGDGPRNNTSVVTDLRIGDNRFLFTADAGVPAIEAALDYLDSCGRTDVDPKLIQIPHHGSRHNLSSDLINRMAGGTSNFLRGSAFVSISAKAVEDPRYPSPRVCNAFGRRGYQVDTTGGKGIYAFGDGAQLRPGWGPLPGLPPLDESIDDR